MRGLIRRTVVAAGAAALALGSAAAVSVATGTTAQAASPCTTSGTTVTCTYTGAGTYSFPVPSGVTSLDVTAVGAAGGDATPANSDGAVSAGGPGASVEDTAVPVSAYQGQTLTVIVGGAGGAGTLDGAAGAGGSPGGGGSGGGGGDFPGGGGGGYSGLLDPSGTTALVIAAGGGGGGFSNSTPGIFPGGAGDTGSGGGTGGGAASAIGPGTGCPTSDNSFFACGGGGGTSTTGGEGGAGSPAQPQSRPPEAAGANGSDGASLAGGQGAPASNSDNNPSGGGGGGGGYYGGGGGGNSDFGAGGGGGSSFGTGPGLTNEATASTAAAVTISYQAPVVPGAPTGVSAIPGNTQISVSWSAPASGGGSAITGYTVSAQANGTTITQTLNDPSATSAVIGGLTNGTAYDITVAAINSVGTGPAAAASGNPVTPTASAPLITSSNSLTVGVGQKLSFKVTAVGKPKPTITASGLPSWATFTPAAAGGSATVSGSPPSGSGGVYHITFGASNGVGFAVTQNATLSVLEFTSATSTTFPLNQPDSFTVTTSLASSSVALSLSGTLPPDVSFNVGSNGTATLSGVPTGKAKKYSITFKATYGTATTTQKFTLTTS
jgi:hypothetical protein